MDSFGGSGFNPNGVECDPEHIASAQPQRCTRQEFEAEIGPDGDRIPRRCEAERDALRCHISRHSREHPLPANFPIIQDTCSNDEIGTQTTAELRELLRVREDARFQLYYSARASVCSTGTN